MAMTLPVVPGRKQIKSLYRPNTFRVINEEAEKHFNSLSESRQQPLSSGGTNIIGQPVLLPETSHSSRHQGNTQFITSDVKTMFGPICHVKTKAVDDGRLCSPWWEHRSSLLPTKPLEPPPHSVDTTVRYDFQSHRLTEPRNTRHSANPNKTLTQGGAPVNFLHEPDGKKRFWKEGVSFEHEFDSRRDPSYPPRGKRQGNFVWNRMSSDVVNNMMKTYGTAASGEICGCDHMSTEPCVDWRPERIRHKYPTSDYAASYKPCQH